MKHSPQIVEMVRVRRAAAAKQGAQTRRRVMTKKRPITIALYHIASASPYHARFVQPSEEGRERRRGSEFARSRSMAHDWMLPGSEFLWSIYERAVYDYFAIGTGNRKYDGASITAEDTAVRGVIDLPSGGQRNILELLGIDASWAWSQIQKAINYTQQKEAA